MKLCDRSPVPVRILLAVILMALPASAEVGKEQNKEGSNYLITREEKLKQMEKTTKKAPEGTKIVNEYGDYVDENILNLLSKFEPIIKVPGFITSKIIPPVARVIGPKKDIRRALNHDKVYIKWISNKTSPIIGERFAIYRPAVVMQSIRKPTEYFIYTNSWKRRSELKKGMRLAGYYYQIRAEIEVTEVKPTLVTGKVTWSEDTLDVGTELIRAPPMYKSISPITGGRPIHATIVAGYPTLNLSPQRGSFVFLNRGAMDGVKVGRIFESWQLVELSEVVKDQPSKVVGKVMVTFVTDHYATGIIMEQFDVIRIGSKMRGMTSGIDKPENFEVLAAYNKRSYLKSASRLDDIEVKMGNLELTTAERRRLEQLHREEILKRRNRSGMGSAIDEFRPSENDPAQTPITNDAPAFFDDSRSRKKQRNKDELSDEQELNQMMQF